MNSLVLEIRQSIVEDRFESYKMEFIRIYQTTDETNRMEQKNRYLNKRHAEDG
jgi:queuine/archaeosine tRNA-ribosyltransferase